MQRSVGDILCQLQEVSGRHTFRHSVIRDCRICYGINLRSFSVDAAIKIRRAVTKTRNVIGFQTLQFFLRCEVLNIIRTIGLTHHQREELCGKQKYFIMTSRGIPERMYLPCCLAKSPRRPHLQLALKLERRRARVALPRRLNRLCSLSVMQSRGTLASALSSVCGQAAEKEFVWASCSFA